MWSRLSPFSEEHVAPTSAAVERLTTRLRLGQDHLVVAVYDSPADEQGFDPLVRARGSACCFAYFKRWQRGETVAFERDSGDFLNVTGGCPGAHRYLGLEHAAPPSLASFLAEEEGLKASVELAQRFVDRVEPPSPSSGSVLLGPLKLGKWAAVRSVSFLVDPDRLSALMALATFWDDASDPIRAPFSSGCGLLWAELEAQGEDRPLIGCTDIAMRRHLPPELLCLTVAPARFEKMLTFPDGCFLDRPWWNELIDSRS
jgi:hypothetical protein